MFVHVGVCVVIGMLLSNSPAKLRRIFGICKKKEEFSFFESTSQRFYKSTSQRGGVQKMASFRRETVARPFVDHS